MVLQRFWESLSESPRLELSGSYKLSLLFAALYIFVMSVDSWAIQQENPESGDKMFSSSEDYSRLPALNFGLVERNNSGR